MDGLTITILLTAVVASAAPIVLAVVGETLAERSGIINLSLDGAILLSAMGAFAVAVRTGSLTAGFVAGGLIGGAVAGVVAVFSLYLRVSQIAVGFVLALMTRDLAYFLGAPYAGISGPQVPPLTIPLLSRIPLAGPILFNHNAVVYLSFVLILVVWWIVNHTPAGLNIRAVGERPEAAFDRGINPLTVRLGCVLGGGLLTGLAGGAYSLGVKAGWGHPQGVEGVGWIVLALVIFGRWRIVRAAMGAYFFAFLQVAGVALQQLTTAIPAQVFQVAPFPLMILTLIFLNFPKVKTGGQMTRGDVSRRSAGEGMPAALGKPWPDNF
jgi:simple sugar transport system permease protein